MQNASERFPSEMYSSVPYRRIITVVFFQFFLFYFYLEITLNGYFSSGLLRERVVQQISRLHVPRFKRRAHLFLSEFR